MTQSNKSQIQFDIITDYEGVKPLLNEINVSADANTNSLGFFASSLYEEYARLCQLYVAVIKKKNHIEYVGHVLFDRRYPRGSILQIYCSEKWRRQGIAKSLINKVIDTLTNYGFISVQARVAEDLTDANQFWNSCGFYIQRIDKGKSKKSRQIIVRVHELETPQLFPTSGLSNSMINPLGLRSVSSTDPPINLIDLNVIFDLGRKRIRHDYATNLFRSVHTGYCRLAVSDEIKHELNRTTFDSKTDPMLQFIDTLPQLSIPKTDEINVIYEKLKFIIFPDMQNDQDLNKNDRSDLRHITTAIWHCLPAFITSDGVLLRAAPNIEKQFGLQVFSPEAFQGNAEIIEQREINTNSDNYLNLRPITSENIVSIRDLLARHQINESAISTKWLPLDFRTIGMNSFGIWSGEVCVGYMTRIDQPRKIIHSQIRAIVDDSHPEAVNVASLLFRVLTDSLSTGTTLKLQLELPIHQSVLREQAHQYGFHATTVSGYMTKIAIGKVLTTMNWCINRENIVQITDLKMPEELPKYQYPSQLIDILSPDGNKRFLQLDALETYLSPVLFCLQGRPAVISPIERRFSEPLLGHSVQRSLLPDSTPALYSERHYLSDPKTIKFLARGTLILFYESGKGNGRQAIIAIARVAEAYLMGCNKLTISQLTRSVLTPRSLNEIGKAQSKAVTVIDNIFLFPNPVPLSTLKQLGCGRNNQLITTRPINNEQLNTILTEGFKSE